MSYSKIAERYAQALFELGEAAGKTPALSEELGRFVEQMKAHASLRQALLSPTVKEEARDALVSALAARLGLSELTTRSVRLVVKRRRAAALPAIAERLSSLVDQKQGVVRAKITTAQELPESFYQGLSVKLASATGKKIVLSRGVDPSLIGGAIAEVGDYTIDNSISGRLAAVERQLLSAGSASTKSA